MNRNAAAALQRGFAYGRCEDIRTPVQGNAGVDVDVVVGRHQTGNGGGTYGVDQYTTIAAGIIGDPAVNTDRTPQQMQQGVGLEQSWIGSGCFGRYVNQAGCFQKHG